MRDRVDESDTYKQTTSTSYTQEKENVCTKIFLNKNCVAANNIWMQFYCEMKNVKMSNRVLIKTAVYLQTQSIHEIVKM